MGGLKDLSHVFPFAVLLVSHTVFSYVKIQDNTTSHSWDISFLSLIFSKVFLSIPALLDLEPH